MREISECLKTSPRANEYTGFLKSADITMASKKELG
jgi:hypothetical protein